MSIARNRLLSTLKRTHFARVTNTQRAFSANKSMEIAVGQRALDRNARIIYITMRSLRTANESTHKDSLMAVWPNIVQDITNISQELNLSDVTEWLTKVLEYNVPGGKNVRGLTLLRAYEMLMPADQKTRENDYLARVLAWCLELLQTFLLILDDIMDRSYVRRKQPCWYRHEEAGLTAAINDAILIESLTYDLFRKYFKEKDCYIDILETFQKNMTKTLMGQSLEYIGLYTDGTPNLDRFTMERYDNIAYYKASYYTFILPVIIAMHFAGIKDQELFRQATTVLLKIGHLYQTQDDYMGIYVDRASLGKINTDIQEGKCTWMIVTALQRATPEQRDILNACYGTTDPEKVRHMRQLYNEMDMQRVYLTYEKEAYDLLNLDIQRMSRNLPQELFREILDDIYHRAK